jgi:hypothetical protein
VKQRSQVRNLKLIGPIAGAIIFLGAPILAIAQSTLEVPPPAQQNQPSFAQPPPPVYDLPRPREGETIQLLPPELFMPQRPAPTPRPPAQVIPREPPPNIVAPMNQGPALPEVFSGCWQGLVSNVDSIRKEPGGHKVGYWTPKTYRLCYKRVGSAPFKLTFTETGVAPNDQLFNVHGGVVPLSTDGRAFATLRATLHFDEYSVGRDATAPTFSVDEVTHLDCKIDGELMTVSAEVHGTRDGVPWFRAHWRADFRHFPD